MKSSSSICLALLFLFSSSEADAFKAQYLCASKYETAAGYAVDKTRPESIAGIATPVRNPASVRLFGIETNETFFLGGGGKAILVELNRNRNAIWYAEQSDAGTIIVWTLFESDGPRPVTLIATKNYNGFGPVSFTAVYSCQ